MLLLQPPSLTLCTPRVPRAVPSSLLPPLLWLLGFPGGLMGLSSLVGECRWQDLGCSGCGHLPPASSDLHSGGPVPPPTACPCPLVHWDGQLGDSCRSHWPWCTCVQRLHPAWGEGRIPPITRPVPHKSISAGPAPAEGRDSCSGYRADRKHRPTEGCGRRGPGGCGCSGAGFGSR